MPGPRSGQVVVCWIWVAPPVGTMWIALCFAGVSLSTQLVPWAMGPTALGVVSTCQLPLGPMRLSTQVGTLSLVRTSTDSAGWSVNVVPETVGDAPVSVTPSQPPAAPLSASRIAGAPGLAAMTSEPVVPDPTVIDAPEAAFTVTPASMVSV